MKRKRIDHKSQIKINKTNKYKWKRKAIIYFYFCYQNYSLIMKLT